MTTRIIINFKWDWSLTSKTKNKALSIDLIPDLIITDLGDPALNTGRIKVLKQLVKKIRNHNEFRSIMTGRLLCLNKVSPHDPKIEDIRPITIISPVRKFLELQLIGKLKKYSNTYLSKCQTGFIENLGTEPNLVTFANTWRGIKKHRFSGALFIDFKSAYDKVPHKRLLRKVGALNILNPNEMDLLRFLISNTFIKIVDAKIDTTFRANQGVPQGSLISPFLFNIFIDDLAKEMETLVGKDMTLLYADDMTVFFKNIPSLGKIILTLDNWSSLNEMSINKKKGKTEILFRNLTGQRTYKTVCKGIQTTKLYKYLGINIDRNLNLTDHLNKLKTLSNITIANINKLSSNCISVDNKLLLYVSLIFSRFRYGSPLLQYTTETSKI